MSPVQLLPPDNSWAWAIATQPALLNLVRSQLVSCNVKSCLIADIVLVQLRQMTCFLFYQGPEIVLFSSQLACKAPGQGMEVPWLASC